MAWLDISLPCCAGEQVRVSCYGIAVVDLAAAAEGGEVVAVIRLRLVALGAGRREQKKIDLLMLI